MCVFARTWFQSAAIEQPARHLPRRALRAIVLDIPGALEQPRHRGHASSTTARNIAGARLHVRRVFACVCVCVSSFADAAVTSVDRLLGSLLLSAYNQQCWQLRPDRLDTAFHQLSDLHAVPVRCSIAAAALSLLWRAGDPLIVTPFLGVVVQRHRRQPAALDDPERVVPLD